MGSTLSLEFNALMIARRISGGEVPRAFGPSPIPRTGAEQGAVRIGQTVPAYGGVRDWGHGKWAIGFPLLSSSNKPEPSLFDFSPT